MYTFNAKGWAMLHLNHLWSAYKSLMNLWTTREQAWFSTPYDPPLKYTGTPYEPLDHPWTSMVFNPLWTIFELHMNPIWTFEPPMNKHGFWHYPKRELVPRTSPGWVQLWAPNRSWNQPDRAGIWEGKTMGKLGAGIGQTLHCPGLNSS